MTVGPEKISTLIEIVNRAEVFCSKVESRLPDIPPLEQRDRVALLEKLGLCRNQIEYLRSRHDFSIENPEVRESLRHLVTAMMWVAFYAGSAIDFKLYRMLLMVESTFTYLLLQQIPKYRRNGQGRDSHE